MQTPDVQHAVPISLLSSAWNLSCVPDSWGTTLSVTEWCVSTSLAVVLSQGCSALPRSVFCNWLASDDCAKDTRSACALGKLVSRMSLPSQPQSCFPSTLLAITVAFKMPPPGQALGEMLC